MSQEPRSVRMLEIYRRSHHTQGRRRWTRASVFHVVSSWFGKRGVFVDWFADRVWRYLWDGETEELKTLKQYEHFNMMRSAYLHQQIEYRYKFGGCMRELEEWTYTRCREFDTNPIWDYVYFQPGKQWGWMARMGARHSIVLLCDGEEWRCMYPTLVQRTPSTIHRMLHRYIFSESAPKKICFDHGGGERPNCVGVE